MLETSDNNAQHFLDGDKTEKPQKIILLTVIITWSS